MKNKLKLFFLVSLAISCFIFFTSSFLFCNALTPQDQFRQIDQKISDLQEVQLKANRQAAKHQDEADRWQFDSSRFNDALNARSQADRAKAQSKALQAQIDLLKAEREELIKQYPELSMETNAQTSIP